MPIIAIDGAEKAGKTTLLNAIAKEWCQRMGRGSIARKYPWGPVADDVQYKGGIVASMDAHDREVVIWDRGWASEAVYGLLMMRPGRRLATDWWLGEWLYGRAVQTVGIRVMLSSSAEERAARRDATDLDVDPYLEGMTFQAYAEQFGWLQVTNDYTAETLQSNAELIVNAALANFTQAVATPPVYCGPPQAQVIVVGERRNEESEYPGAWLPLTTPLTIKLGRSLAERALDFGWTNAFDVPPAAVRGAKVLVALGERAESWAKFQVGHDRIVNLPHPAWLYRYGKAAHEIPRVEQTMRELSEEFRGIA